MKRGRRGKANRGLESLGNGLGPPGVGEAVGIAMVTASPAPLRPPGAPDTAGGMRGQEEGAKPPSQDIPPQPSVGPILSLGFSLMPTSMVQLQDPGWKLGSREILGRCSYRIDGSGF